MKQRSPAVMFLSFMRIAPGCCCWDARAGQVKSAFVFRVDQVLQGGAAGARRLGLVS